MTMRIETDSMGEILVPADAYYGAQTARSLNFFNIGGNRMPLPIIHAFGRIKKCAAMVNYELGLLSKEKMEWIVQAAQEILEGKLDHHFPLSIWQTGSGTQTNMNINEVISNRAIELSGGKLGSKIPVHPNDDVNRSQSSNDTFPTAMHLAAVQAIHQKLIPSIALLHQALTEKSEEFAAVVKIGRTHLMDAVPLTLGQEFSGYVDQVKQNRERIENSLHSLYELALGGTAVGTGLHAPKGFAEKVIQELEKETGYPFTPARNKFSALASHDALVAAHGAIRVLAASLIKIVTDLAFLGSGPRCGFAELFFPEDEPGSSIMPGKINPTQCEALTMVCVHILGNDHAIAIAGSRGNFELNVLKPVIIFNFLDSCTLLSEALNSFTQFFIKGVRPNLKKIRYYLDHSLMLVTALTPYIGYDKAAQVAHKAFYEEITLKEACLALQYLSEAEFDKIVDPAKMALDK